MRTRKGGKNILPGNGERQKPLWMRNRTWRRRKRLKWSCEDRPGGPGRVAATVPGEVPRESRGRASQHNIAQHAQFSLMAGVPLQRADCRCQPYHGPPIPTHTRPLAPSLKNKGPSSLHQERVTYNLSYSPWKKITPSNYSGKFSAPSS